MSAAARLQLAARVVERALELLDRDPVRARQALERLRERLVEWSAVAASDERAADLELLGAHLEVDELEEQNAALLAELDLVDVPVAPCR